MATMNLSVVAPDRTVVEDTIQSLIAPAHEGYMGVQPGHIPAIVALKPGLLEYRDSAGQREFVAIGGGFMEVTATGVIVLADDAHRAEEVDVAEAEKALEQARRALRGEESTFSKEQATLELDRAMARIKVARQAK
ncbi:MAG: ATP synthase F1 subunit epsilon [Armatimonadetes bacterium]|nr:ATP synthase F1 subunit epsilon [Armatimonadota bacterium]